MAFMTGVIGRGGGNGMIDMIRVRVGPGLDFDLDLNCGLMLLAGHRGHGCMHGVSAAGLAADPGIGRTPGSVGRCGRRVSAAVLLESRYMACCGDAGVGIGRVALLRADGARHQHQGQAIFEGHDFFPENDENEGQGSAQGMLHTAGARGPGRWSRRARQAHGSCWPAMLVGQHVDQDNLGGRSRPVGMNPLPGMPSAAKRDSDIAWPAAGAGVDGGALAPVQQAAQALHDAWWVAAESEAESEAASTPSDGQCTCAA